MDRLKTHQLQIILITRDIPYLNYTESNPHKLRYEEKYSYNLGILCNTMFWLHQRGVVCGAVEPEDIKDNVMYFHGAYLDIGIIKKYKQYYLGEESSQMFDLFFLGILGLLQHIAETKGTIEANNFSRKYMRNVELFSTLYKENEFEIFPKLNKFWRSCLNKDPRSRPSSFSYPLTCKTLQLPIPCSNNIGNCNDSIIEGILRYRFCEFPYKIVMMFDLLRKLGVEDPYEIVESFATKSSTQTTIDYPVLNCDTIQLYYIVDSSSIFYDAISSLASMKELNLLPDSYIIEYLHNYADYKCVN